MIYMLLEQCSLSNIDEKAPISYFIHTTNKHSDCFENATTVLQFILMIPHELY